MDSQHSFKKLFLYSLLAVTPVVVSARTTIQSCLTGVGVPFIGSSSPNWTIATTPWQLRLKVNPLVIAYPANRVQLAATLDCASQTKHKCNPYNSGHSFGGYGYGFDGNVVIDMGAFQEFSYDPITHQVTLGGGVRVGPALDYLWNSNDTRRHIPHVRQGSVSIAGSCFGGGWGSTSRYYGTPGDAIVGAEVMLANGTIITGGPNSDLVWAVKGAGASIGIVLSLTLKTYAPEYPTAVNFTIAVGVQPLEVISKMYIDIQSWSYTAPDTLALRLHFATGRTAAWRASGYIYGDPAKAQSILDGLLKNFPAGSNLTTQVQDFWSMEKSIAPGTGQPKGGVSPGRSFYQQSHTITTDNPLDITDVQRLLGPVIYEFNRTDLRPSGLLDLMGGVSRDLKDSDTSYAHGKNLWLIRLDGNTFPANVTGYPDDGVAYMKSRLKPFEDYRTSKGIKLRSFGNYPDTAAPISEWSARVYGDNWPRLLAIKRALDPKDLFTSNGHSVPAIRPSRLC